MTRKQQVADAFAAASETYDTAAQAQVRSGGRLAELVVDRLRKPNPRVLEVGCGTGLLTRALMPAVGGDWLITDLSPAMVETARREVGQGRFAVMDGEHPDGSAGPFDLIVSNLAGQWFLDLEGAVSRLAACLAPGGLLALSTLAHGSLREWRAAHAELGLADGVMDFPTFDALRFMMPARADLQSQVFAVTHVDGRDFLSSIRAIGARLPAPGYRPLTPGAMRGLIRKLGSPVEISYHVVHVLLVRE
jgi:malonyl-CoA O-methyltransferase